MLASELEYVSACNPQIRLVIFIVSTGIQIVLAKQQQEAVLFLFWQFQALFKNTISSKGPESSLFSESHLTIVVGQPCLE